MSETPDGDARLRGCQVLVIEDDYMIGDALTGLLQDAGATVVGPLGTVADAKALLGCSDTRLDFAVLDIDLHGERSYAIADRLVELGVPFLFTTGYSHDAVAAAYRDHPRMQKPLSGRLLIASLARMKIVPTV